MTLNHQPENLEPEQTLEFSESQAQLPTSTPSVVQTPLEPPEGATQVTEASQTEASRTTNPQNEDLSFHKFGFNKQDTQASPTVDPLTFATICVLVGGAVLISNPHIFKPRPIFEASSANTADAIDVSQLRALSNIPQADSFNPESTALGNQTLTDQIAGENNSDLSDSEALAQGVDTEAIPKRERPLTQFEVGLIQASRWTPPANAATQAIPPAPIPTYSFYQQRGTQPQSSQSQLQNTPQDQRSQSPSGQPTAQNPQPSPDPLAQQEAANRERLLQEQLAQREALLRQQQQQAQQRQQELLRVQQQQEQLIREQQIRQQREGERQRQARIAAAQEAARREAKARQEALIDAAARPKPASTPLASSLTGLGFTVGARPSEGFTVGAFQRGTATDSCLAPTDKLTPLAPPVPDQDLAPVDFTQASDSLTFFVHVPATEATTAQFTFEVANFEPDNLEEVNSGKQLYNHVISLKSQQAQVIGIQVPKTIAEDLQVGQSYLWQFALRCNPNNPSTDPIARGGVVRKATSPDLPQTLAARAIYYAENSFWPDAVSAVAQLHQQAPDDPVVLSNLRSLFRNAGLPSFVNQAPITIFTKEQDLLRNKVGEPGL